MIPIYQSFEEDDSQYPHLQQIIQMISAAPQPLFVPYDGAELEIIFSPSGTSVRKVCKRSNYRMTMKFPSLKNARTIECESATELAGARILESCPLVVSYLQQPATIQYVMDGKTHSHVPDMLVEIVGGKMFFIEFKLNIDLDDEHFINRSKLLAELLPAKGYRYLVIIKQQLEGVPMANAMTLLRSTHREVQSTIREQIRLVLVLTGKMKFHELLSKLPLIKHAKQYVFGLMLTGDISYDCFNLITEESDLTWTTGR